MTIGRVQFLFQFNCLQFNEELLAEFGTKQTGYVCANTKTHLSLHHSESVASVLGFAITVVMNVGDWKVDVLREGNEN